MSFAAAYHTAQFIGHQVQGLFCHLSHRLEPSLFPDQPCNNNDNQTAATTTLHHKSHGIFSNKLQCCLTISSDQVFSHRHTCPHNLGIIKL